MALLEKFLAPLQLIFHKQHKRILTAIMVVLLVVNVILILIPLGQNYYELYLRSAELRDELYGARHDQGQEGRMSQTFKWSKTRLVLDEYLIAQGDIAQYLESLTSLADKTGVRLISMAPVSTNFDAETKEKANYQFAYFKMSASAPYHKVGMFVSSLENHSFFIEIIELEIKSRKTAPHEHEVNLVIRMLQDKTKEGT